VRAVERRGGRERVTEQDKKPGSSRGNFFAIDRRSWALACAEGINAAVAYLVLARFSGRDNSTTAASVNALENYTRISRHRSQRAIQALCDRGLVRQVAAGTRPRYTLAPYAAVPNVAPPAMSPEQLAVYERIRAGEQTLPRDLVRLRNALMKAGWIERGVGGGFAVRVQRDLLHNPSWIWLPNSIVDGAAGEVPPCELLRQTQDTTVLRLFVDLYYEQHLTEHGGIARNVIWQNWDREKIGERGEHVVWGFRSSGNSWVSWTMR
jgi:hypothetical protein